MSQIVVVGAGVVGLALAWELERTGRRVTVLERDEPGGEASRAAGGMLAPLGEADDPGPFLDFAMESLALYPDWIRQVEAASGLAVGFRRCGKLLAALDGPTEEGLRDRAQWQAASGHPVTWLDPAAARRVEPALSPDVRGALHLSTDGQVDNRRLHRALLAAARASGVSVRFGAEVREVLHDRDGVRGVTLGDTTVVEARRVVLAAGAWSGGVEGVPTPLPIRPVRGQMVQLGPTRVPLHGLVATPEAYLIPRPSPGGPTVLVGASQEEVGFDVRTDPDTLRRLREGAVAVLPGLARAPIADSWAGLRPATPDGLPVLGPDPGAPGLVHASGHFRNGILLAPATASMLARTLEGDTDAVPPAFRPERFTG